MNLTKLAHEKLLAAIEHEKMSADSARAAMHRSEEDAKLKIDLLHEVRSRDQVLAFALVKTDRKGA
jgi:hypothetical protein